MKQRILTGWSFQRALFLFMGVMVIIQAVIEQQWIGVVFGAYFASMGLFALGCASGACYSGKACQEPETTDKSTIPLNEYQEIKSK